VTTTDRTFITDPVAARARLSQWTTWIDYPHWVPFVEDENANITGPGHQAPEAFVIAVFAYDHANAPGHAEKHDPGEVQHQWALLEADEEGHAVPCAPDAPGAVPITTIWGVR